MLTLPVSQSLLSVELKCDLSFLTHYKPKEFKELFPFNNVDLDIFVINDNQIGIEYLSLKTKVANRHFVVIAEIELFV